MDYVILEWSLSVGREERVTNNSLCKFVLLARIHYDKKFSIYICPTCMGTIWQIILYLCVSFLHGYNKTNDSLSMFVLLSFYWLVSYLCKYRYNMTNDSLSICPTFIILVSIVFVEVSLMYNPVCSMPTSSWLEVIVPVPASWGSDSPGANTRRGRHGSAYRHGVFGASAPIDHLLGTEAPNTDGPRQGNKLNP